MIRPVVIVAGLFSHLLVAGCSALPGPLAGLNTPDPELEACRRAIVMQADRNSDGVLDPAEAAAHPMSLPYGFFDRVDENQDGVLDRQEYERMGLFVRCELCPKVADCPNVLDGAASIADSAY